MPVALPNPLSLAEVRDHRHFLQLVAENTFHCVGNGQSFWTNLPLACLGACFKVQISTELSVQNTQSLYDLKI